MRDSAITPRTEEPAARPGRALLCWTNAFVFAAFPIVAVLASNLGTYPINGWVLARALLAVAVVTGVLLWSLRCFGWSLEARAGWLSVFFLAWNHYFLLPIPRIFQDRVGSGSVVFALGYVAACAVLAGMIIRPWKTGRRDPVPLTIVAAVLLGMNVLHVVRAVSSRDAPTWRTAAERLTRPFPRATNGPIRPQRDVYVIVLDAFGRADVLRETYGTDLSGLVASLEARGVYVPAYSRGNYAQTFLALSSLLNMGYLDEVADALGPQSRDRRPLKYLIEHNALMRSARRAGFTVIAIASDYTATESFPEADVCVCPLPHPHELEYIAVNRTPLGDLGRDTWISAGRRRHVLWAFDAIEHAMRRPGPKLVFAHIVSPHPPFVFDRDGRPRMPPQPLPFIRGEWLSRADRALPGFADEYLRGYADQASFIAHRVVRLVSSLLSQPGPQPAFMIVGDHGPALHLDLEDIDRTDLHERMSVFSAYHVPGNGHVTFDPAISPVNGARLLASQFLGVDAPPLAERSAFSTFLQPYSLVDLPPENR
jgi:hypothetical protein